MDDSKNVSYCDLFRYTWHLSKSKIIPDISIEKLGIIRKCFDCGDYDQVIAKVLGSMGLKTKVKYGFMSNNALLDEIKKFPNSEVALQSFEIFNTPIGNYTYKELAHVSVKYIPFFGTESFRNYETPMKIGESMKYESFESFVTVLAHEFMHISLFSRMHPLRDSEVATDIGILLTGYAEVARVGRIGRNQKPIGYLTNKQFNFVYRLIKIIKFLKKKKIIK